MTVVMFAINWRFALLALSIAPFLFVVVYRFTRRSKKASRTVRKQEGRISSMVQEVLSSMRVVQAYTREDYEQRRFEDENQRRVVSGIQTSTLKATLAPLVELLVTVGTALVLWYGAHEVLVGRLTPGALLVFLAYLSRLYGPMRNLSKFSDVMFRASVGLERIYGVLETEREVRDLPGARPAGPLRGRIEFEHVWFAYKGEDWVLKDVSFTVEPGQSVALVGHTGSGKTTITNLLMRFYDVQRGQVLLDGVDVREWELKSLRENFAVVLQDVFLFSGTVEGNIRLGREDVSDERVRWAAREVHADGFIERLPEGYKSEVRERGAGLSVGQKQLISFARALAFDPALLILDEATSSIDTETEQLIQ